MHGRCSLVRAMSAMAAAGVLLLTTVDAHAVPITHPVVSGTAQIRVFVGATEIGSTNTTLLGGSVVIDHTAQSLDAVAITLGPNIPLSLSTPYGGYDNVVIENVSVSDGAGYTSTLLSSIGSTFQVSAGPLDVAGSWGATDSGGTNPPAANVPIGFSVPLLLAIVNGSLEMNGVTLAAIDGTPFGETEPLQILADLQIALVPEPGTAVLFGFSLAALSAAARSKKGRL